MKLVEDIDVLNIDENPKMQKWMTRATTLILLPGFLLVLLVWVRQGMNSFPNFGAFLGTFFYVVLVTATSMVFHELIHAAFFKLFGPAGTRIKFGMATGMLYAGCPGTYFSRNQFLVILLAPLVILTLVLVATGVIFKTLVPSLIVAVLHGSGCVGDLYFVARINAHTSVDTCLDSSRGARLLDSTREA